MHCYPARVITPSIVWSPTTARESQTPGEFVIDAKDGQRLATITDASVVPASDEQRALLNTERLWIVSGNREGVEPVTWAVTMARGCGCGGTVESEPTDIDLQVLA